MRGDSAGHVRDPSPSAREHSGKHCLGQAQRPNDVDRQRQCPKVGVDAHGWPERCHDGRVVDQDVYRTELRQYHCRRLVDSRGITHVSRHRECRAARGIHGGGDFTNKYAVAHESLALTSTVAFAATGLLALFAPTPYKKPIKLDAGLVHKVMMGIATAGMVTQIALGFVTADKGGELIQRDLALTHMVVGYTTFAAMAAGYLAWVF